MCAPSCETGKLTTFYCAHLLNKATSGLSLFFPTSVYLRHPPPVLYPTPYAFLFFFFFFLSFFLFFSFFLSFFLSFESIRTPILIQKNRFLSTPPFTQHWPLIPPFGSSYTLHIITYMNLELSSLFYSLSLSLSLSHTHAHTKRERERERVRKRERERGEREGRKGRETLT